MIEFKLSESRWLRGERSSYLLRISDRKQCCLGQFLSQAGVSDDDLEGLASPGALEAYRMREVGVGGGVDEILGCGWMINEVDSSQEAYAMMMVNDNPAFSDEDRIFQLTELFAKVGYRLVLVP